MSDSVRESKIGSVIFSALTTYALAGLFTGNLKLLDEQGPVIVSGLLWKLALAAAVIIWTMTAVWRRNLVPARVMNIAFLRRLFGSRVALKPVVFVFGLALVLAGDYMTKHFVFYAYHAHSLINPLSMLGLGLVLALIWVLFARKNPENVLFSPLVLLLCQAAITLVFIRHTAGRLILSDDHPSFLYRLNLVMDNFPNIPFYNPEWNAGSTAYDSLSTGTLNVFFLSWPLLKLWGEFARLEHAAVYTYLIAYLFVLIVPWSVWTAARLLGLSRPSATAAAILALGPSLLYFEWMLKFGTMGFLVSTGLFPLAFALSAKLLFGPRPRWRDVPLAAGATSLCLFWMLSFVFFIPLGVYSLLCFHETFSPSRRAKAAVFVLLIALVNGPWAYAYTKAFDVVELVSRSSLPGSTTTAVDHAGQHQMNHGHESPNAHEQQVKTAYTAKITRAYKKFRGMLAQINPVVFFLFLPAFFLISERKYRTALAATIGWLLLVSASGYFYKPQLELNRMVIPASLLMALLAGAGTVYILQQFASASGSSRKKALAVLPVTVLTGMFFISPLNVAQIYLQRSDHFYALSTPEVSNLVNAIRRLPDRGRTFFFGFSLHRLGASSTEGRDGGHLAPLPRMTGKSMYAMVPVHSVWSSVEAVPAEFRAERDAGIEQFLDLINASAVAAFSANWKHFLSTRPNYRLEYQDGMISLFSRENAPNNWFLQGSGEITKIADDRVELIASTPEAIIKFRWVKLLKSSPTAGVTIEPFPVYVEDLGGGKKQQVSFIKLKIADKLLGQKITLGFHL